MSYLVQFARLGVASAQLSELHNLNAQFQQQHNAHRQQAILGDILFQTERRAKQLSAVATSDPLVAAIFADEWLASVHRVSVDSFVQVEHKRAWSAASARLQALRSTLDHPQARDEAHQARSAAADVQQIYGDLGNAPNPEAQAAALHQEHATLTRQSGRAMMLGLGLGAGAIGAPILLIIIGAIAGAILGGPRQKVEVDTGLLTSIGMLALFGLGAASVYHFAQWSDGGTKAKRTLARLESFKHALGRLQAFSSDPNRGGVLQRFYAAHPAYGQPLPNVDDLAPLSMAAPVSAHVVERQTVVVRCKYCQALTPVDARNCHNCGTAGFA